MVVAPINLLFESALLLGSISFSLAVFVLAKDVSNKLNLSFSCLALNVSLWALSFFIAGVMGSRTAASIHIITTLLLTPLSMIFMQVLLRVEGWLFLWWTRLALFLSIVLVPLVTFGLDTYSWIRELSFFSPVLIVFAVLYLYLSEAFGMVMPRGGSLSNISRKDLLNALRTRNTWLYLGGAVVTMTCVMDRVPWMGRIVPAVGNLILAIYIYGLKDIVLEREYVNLRSLLARMIADSGTAIVLASVFILTTVWVSNNPLLYFLNVFLVSYLAIFSAVPIRSLLMVFYQRFFFKEASRIDDLIQLASRELSGAFDSQSIGRVIDSFLQRAIGVQLHTFYALDEEGRKFEKIYDATLDGRLPRSVSVAFPLLLHWQKAEDWKPILVSEMQNEAERATVTADTVAIQLTLESLLRLESSLALPLVLENSVTGFVTVRIDSPPTPWGSSWGILGLLKPFFLRAGEALHDLDVYVSLRERERLAVLGEMSAGLAHEIRNPLGAIKGAAQVLELHARDSREPFIGIIIEEVNRLNDVVTKFLNYAKPFKGESKYVDLNQLVNQVLQRFLRKLDANEAPRIKVSFEPAPNLERAYCQEDLIGQVIMNLLENARSAIFSTDAASAGELKLQIRAEEGESNNLFTIEVSDNGSGIKKEYLDKIFIPFFSMSKDGTGLGLPICKKIAEAHGGRIELESEENRGTRAILRFPSRRKALEIEQ